MLSRAPAAFRSLRNPAQSAFKVSPFHGAQLLIREALQFNGRGAKEGTWLRRPIGNRRSRRRSMVFLPIRD
jgi:hypothetical protein